MPHYSHSTGEKPLRSWHGDTEARRAEEADRRRPVDKQAGEAKEGTEDQEQQSDAEAPK